MHPRPRLPFTPSRRLTLGVEWELQFVDRESRDLAPVAPAIFRALGGKSERIKPEVFQEMVEVTTEICASAEDARHDLQASLARLARAADKVGVDVASGGTHPFARYADSEVSTGQRYQMLMTRERWIARRLMIFGLHVHIGMVDADQAVAVLNGMLWHAPLLLALSANSPFWQGLDTGLASARATVFEASPVAGHPCTYESWAEFEALYGSLVRAKSITSIKDFWWDIRPHPDFGTIELRFCDALPTLRETIALVALAHCLAGRLVEQYEDGLRMSPPPMWMIRENKWRASRLGMRASFVVREDGETERAADTARRLVEELAPTARKLGCAKALRDVLEIVKVGNGAVRQRGAFERRERHEDVVASLVRQLRDNRIR